MAVACRLRVDVYIYIYIYQISHTNAIQIVCFSSLS